MCGCNTLSLREALPVRSSVFCPLFGAICSQMAERRWLDRGKHTRKSREVCIAFHDGPHPTRLQLCGAIRQMRIYSQKQCKHCWLLAPFYCHRNHLQAPINKGLITTEESLVVCSSCLCQPPEAFLIPSREMDIAPVLKRLDICHLDMAQQAKVACSGARGFWCLAAQSRKKSLCTDLVLYCAFFSKLGFIFCYSAAVWLRRTCLSLQNLG